MNMNPMQMLQMLQNSGNPSAMMQQMFGNNPMFQRAQSMLQGKSHRAQMKILENMCKQRGMDLNQLKQMFGIQN
jgi:hypothetical protein